MLKKQFPRNCKRYRNVNTWSSLATAFNSINKEKYGFDFLKKETVSIFFTLLYFLYYFKKYIFFKIFIIICIKYIKF